MSLINKLLQNGSQLSAANGGKIDVNPLATQASKMHADGSNPGYSLNGAGAQTVNADFQLYRDGVNNILPAPTVLDRETKISKYTDNLPK